MLKILYVTWGGNIHDRRFLKKLAQGGYTTCYAYLHPSGRHDVDPSWNTVISHHLGFAAVNKSKLSKAFALLKSYHILTRLLRYFRPDVLHAGWIQTAGLVAALSKYRPFLLMPWGSDVLVYPKRGKIARSLTRYVVQRADMIACDAEVVKREIIRFTDYPANKVVVFPWGVDLEVFQPSPALREVTRKDLGFQNNKVIIMTRNLYPVYGVDYFLRALPSVFAQVPNARALLAGSGELESELRALAERLGISDKIRFLGAVPNNELPRYLNAADLYVSTSLSDGTSLSLLEAFACALPVVVTDVEANLEWVEHGINGLVVRRRDVRGLADAIVLLLRNEHLSRRMRERNLERARERADWNKNFSVLERLYEQMTLRK